MKYFSMFSGYGGFELGIERAFDNGKKQENEDRPDDSTNGKGESSQHGRRSFCVGQSEIDKYACAVLRYRFPDVKNYGDCTRIDWGSVPDFDLLVGGSPCQSFSIAGKRKGLDGASGLVWEYIRCLTEKKPRYFIWENVKGALSSRRGIDFANILSVFSEQGYDLWWQVLNAKDFGVPQNRERVFVIGVREGSPREVFFEREDDRKIVSEGHSGSGGQKGIIYGGDGIVGSSSATDYKQPKQIQQLNNPTHSNNRIYGDKGLSPSLNTAQGGNRQPKIVERERERVIVHNTQPRSPDRPSLKYSSGGSGHLQRDDGITYTIDTGNTNAVEVIPVLTPDRPNKRQNGRRFKENGDPAFSLTAQDKHGVMMGTRIRRLTPVECERLMGLPDGWTSKGIDDKGNEIEISDSQRYKLCGNGVVVNVIEALVKTMLGGENK